MLKCDLNEDTNIAKIEVRGNVLEIAEDLTYLFNRLYKAINSDSPIVGAVFKEILQDCVADDNSPVWKLQADQKPGKDGVKKVSFQIPGGIFDNFMGGGHGE